MTEIKAPFAHTYRSGTYIYGCMLFALLLPTAWAVYMFGGRVAVQLALSVIVTTGIEIIYGALRYGKAYFKTCLQTVGSAVITGVMVALLCPASAPHFVPMFMALTAMLVKVSFGGVGKNLLNPAVTGAFAAEMLFGNIMSSCVLPYSYHKAFTFTLGSDYINAADAVSPLTYMLSGGDLNETELLSMFFGTVPGKNGEVSLCLLLVSGVILLVTGFGEYKAGAGYLGVLFIMAFFFPLGDSEATYYAIWQVMTGSAVFVAVFAFSDPTTTPKYSRGRLVFGVGCALLTYVFRVVFKSFDGAYPAVLVMNLLTPMIDKVTAPAYQIKSAKKVKNDV